jgi:hypothetical protein
VSEAFVARYDAARLGRTSRTPQGFLRAPANLTRTGVLVYRRADGTTHRELRRPEQVFRSDSLASLADAPLTDLHPKEMVTPVNARALTLGHVSQSTVRADGRFVAGDVVVTDAAMIADIEGGKRCELSPGYKCKLLVGAGVWNGEHYDAEQVDIEYNHVGVGPKNWGRSGAEVALRLDGSSEQLPADAAWLDAADEPEPEKTPQKGTAMELVTIRVDGIDCQVPPAAAQVISRGIEQRDAALAAAKTEATGHKARCDTLQGELDGTKLKLTEAADPKRFDTAVAERIDLLGRARAVLGDEAKLDGLAAREIKELVVKHFDAAADFKGKSDEYVQGRFDAAEAGISTAPTPLEQSRSSITPLPRKDGNGGGHVQPPPPPWRQPLASSRKS